MLRLLVCVSGGGTNLQAIFDAIDAGKIRNAEIAAVISNNPGAYALERARQHNVEAICLSPKSFESREAFNHALTEKVKEIAPDLIVLAGFLVAVPAEMIEAFPNQIINIHPSLIPAFCGVGFYGLHVHEGVLARGAKVTGATVHFVDNGMDTGPIILQKAVAAGRYTQKSAAAGHGGSGMENFAPGHRPDCPGQSNRCGWKDDYRIVMQNCIA